ncbi:YdbL family probable chaperone protein [Silanimonas algicola]
MRPPLMKLSVLLLPVVLLASCVTINVYFPAAEAQKAAEEFVEDVIGGASAASGGSTSVEHGEAGRFVAATVEGRGVVPVRVFSHTEARFDPLGFLIASAHAQENVDIRIRTPAIQAIQARMAERFQGRLAPLFDAGAMGFGNDGLVVLRDPSKVPLAQRTAANQAVAEENRDRNAVYREIAVANGHPEWETQIRQTFAKEWVAQARAGWWYQDSAGGWKQK